MATALKLNLLACDYELSLYRARNLHSSGLYAKVGGNPSRKDFWEALEDLGEVLDMQNC